jgi:hypothetical protein
MPDRDLVAALLGTDARDAGCDAGMDVLDRFVEAEIDGRPVATIFPEVAAHLVVCPDCAQDHEGLLELVRPPAGADA